MPHDHAYLAPLYLTQRSRMFLTLTPPIWTPVSSTIMSAHRFHIFQGNKATTYENDPPPKRQTRAHMRFLCTHVHDPSMLRCLRTCHPFALVLCTSLEACCHIAFMHSRRVSRQHCHTHRPRNPCCVLTFPLLLSGLPRRSCLDGRGVAAIAHVPIKCVAAERPVRHW